MFLCSSYMELKKRERSYFVIAVEALLITMMAFHGITWFIHIIFILLEDLQTDGPSLQIIFIIKHAVIR